MSQEYLNQLQVSIASLSSDELKNLLNDDEKLDRKVEEGSQALISKKDELLTENRDRAETNIEKEPTIIELRGKVHELASTAKECCDSVQGKLAELKNKSGDVSQDTALALLQAAAAESEEESEEVVRQLKENEINVEMFLEKFLIVRKTMHLRKFKAEKMQELIRESHNKHNSSGSVGIPSYSNLPMSGFYPNVHHGGSVPYPLGPMMPMPPPRPY